MFILPKKLKVYHPDGFVPAAMVTKSDQMEEFLKELDIEKVKKPKRSRLSPMYD